MRPGKERNSSCKSSAKSIPGRGNSKSWGERDFGPRGTKVIRVQEGMKPEKWAE